MIQERRDLADLDLRRQRRHHPDRRDVDRAALRLDGRCDRRLRDRPVRRPGAVPDARRSLRCCTSRSATGVGACESCGSPSHGLMPLAAGGDRHRLHRDRHERWIQFMLGVDAPVSFLLNRADHPAGCSSTRCWRCRCTSSCDESSIERSRAIPAAAVAMPIRPGRSARCTGPPNGRSGLPDSRPVDRIVRPRTGSDR